MKILVDGHILTHSKKTGIEIHAEKIIQYLSLIISIDVAKPYFDNKYYTHFWEHFILPFKARNYDILFSPSNIAPFWLFPNTKLILTSHDLAFIDFAENYSFVYKKYYQWLIPRNILAASHIITVSNNVKGRLLKEYKIKSDRITTIYHGISEVFLKQKIETKEHYILYVGSMSNTKNYQSVIRAFIALENKNIKLKMVLPKINTFSTLSSNQIYTKALKNENIVFIDYVTQDTLKALYSKATLFIFPSYYESFGFPPLEAMASGTPVIVSNTGALPEIYGNASLYVDPYDISDITQKIEILLNDTNLQKLLVEKGLKRVKKFTWEKSAQEHIKVFKKL